MLSPSLVLTRPAHRRRAVGEAPLLPLAGILDAPNVVILGASLEKYGFATSAMADGAVHADILAYAAAMGFTGTLRCHAIAGSLLSSSIGQHATVAALAPVAAVQGQNLYICGGGGNNVTNARPYPGGAAAMATDYATLAANVAARGDRLIPLELTKRLYPGAPAVVHGDAASEANGSLPYNAAIIRPRIALSAPDWLDAGGAPWIDTYGLAARWPELLTDGTHGYGHQFGHHILSRLAARARGLRQGDARPAGQAILWKPVDSTRAIGTVNTLASWSSGTPDPAFFFHTGAIRTDGGVEHFLNIISQKFVGRSAGPGTSAHARLADARFHALPFGSNAAYYVQSGSAVEAVTLTFQNLNPGERIRLSVAGCANSSSGTRRTLATLLPSGEALSIPNHTTAASNQGVFAPVTVPASGQIALTIAPDVAGGGTYGYLGGLILDWL